MFSHYPPPYSPYSLKTKHRFTYLALTFVANLQVNDEVAAMIASMSRVDTDYSRGAAAATVGGGGSSRSSTGRRRGTAAAAASVGGGGSSRSGTGRRRGTTITGADGTVYYVKSEN